MAAAGIRVDRVVAAGTSVRFDASTTTQTATCPACRQPARRVHSRYTRWLDDLGVAGRQVRIRLQVRRWRCDTADCARKIFAEQPAGLTSRSQRRTPPLAATLAQIGLALGGRAGERLTSHLATPVSRMTLLRLVRSLPQPVVEAAALRVVGVDEFAFRRGHTYGTVLVDMATRRPVDLLEDRAADTLAVWLKGHPDLEVICRDRAGAYADGATRGALQATQVADRWHLLNNLADVVERVIKRHRSALRHGQDRQDADSAHPTDTADAAADALAVAVAVVEGRRAATTRQRHAQVHELANRGMNLAMLCHTLGLDPKTIRRYQHATSPEELLAPAAQRATTLDVYKPYLARRFGEGCTNAAWLWAELRQQGYHGSRRTVRRYLTTLRMRASADADADAEADHAQLQRRPPLSVRTVRRWVLRRPERLCDRDRQQLATICARSPALATAVTLAQGFAHLARERRGDQLTAWVDQVEASDVPELRAFAAGLRKDWDAVVAGLTLPWSSGAVEGHVNRIKMLKRQMYGRASLDLLRQRVLLAH